MHVFELGLLILNVWAKRCKIAKLAILTVLETNDMYSHSAKYYLLFELQNA